MFEIFQVAYKFLSRSTSATQPLRKEHAHHFAAFLLPPTNLDGLPSGGKSEKKTSFTFHTVGLSNSWD